LTFHVSSTFTNWITQAPIKSCSRFPIACPTRYPTASPTPAPATFSTHASTTYREAPAPTRCAQLDVYRCIAAPPLVWPLAVFLLSVCHLFLLFSSSHKPLQRLTCPYYVSYTVADYISYSSLDYFSYTCPDCVSCARLDCISDTCPDQHIENPLRR
jgi:hypothetical protein